MARWILFFITIIVGVAGGLTYAWFVSPVEYVDTPPTSLREDYKADYVLMVAEAFYADADLDLAMRRLALLGDPLPLQTVLEALRFAEQAPYAESDIARMLALANALRIWNPALELPEP